MTDTTTIEKPGPTSTPLVVGEPDAQKLPATVAPADNAAVPAPIKKPIDLPPPPTSAGKFAIAIAQIMNKIGTIQKSGYNKFHQYNFARFEDIVGRISPLMADAGLVVLQTEVERVMFDGGNVVAIKYAFTMMLADGEVYPERIYQTGVSRCRDSKQGFDDKSFAKAHSAARKYFLLALFQIPTGDVVDPDDDDDQPGPRPTADPLAYGAAELRAAAEENTKHLINQMQGPRSIHSLHDWGSAHSAAIASLKEAGYDDLYEKVTNAYKERMEKLDPKWKKAEPAPPAPQPGPDAISTRATAAREELSNDEVADLLRN